mgnify:FL=1|tara:strand:+ start:1037 stop:1735 length:699 start_codon:yes stop_codon:yes gene_type:complete
MNSNTPSDTIDLQLNTDQKDLSKELQTSNDLKKENSIKDNTEVTQETSHIMTGEYVTLMETNGKECESWYYFIRCKDNMEALEHLQQQLEAIDWYILDDLSTFDLDLEHLVDAKTAKQITKLELNSYSFHRKFDGKLEKINFNFKKKDMKNNNRLMEKVFDLIGYGQIEDYINDEDIDSEDLETGSDTDTEDESEPDSSSDDNEKLKSKIPSSLMDTGLPKWVKAKRKNNKR